MDLLTLFFQDVSRIPVINGKHEYLPFVRCARRGFILKEYQQRTSELTLYHLVRQLIARVEAINEWRLRNDVPAFDLHRLGDDATSLFRDKISTTPLYLSEFEAGLQTEVTTNGKTLAESAWHCLYLMALLPESCQEIIIRNELPTFAIPNLDLHFEEIARDADKAKNHIIEGSLRHAIKIARHYVGRGVPYLDLVQEGILGLNRAVERFDESQSAHFQSYAATWIIQAITRYIADTSRMIRVPVHFLEDSERMMLSAYHFEETYGRPPSEYDLYLELGWFTEDELDWYDHHKKTIIAYDHNQMEPNQSYEDDENLASIQYIATENTNVGRDGDLSQYQDKLQEISTRLKNAHKYYERFQMVNAKHYPIDGSIVQNMNDMEMLKIDDFLCCTSDLDTSMELTLLPNALESVLSEFDFRSRVIIKHRYGLIDGSERTLEELGQMFGITRERIRQIEEKAFRQLQHPGHARRLLPYRKESQAPIWHEHIEQRLRRRLALLAYNPDNDDYEGIAGLERQRIDALIKKYVPVGRKQRVGDTRRYGGSTEIIRGVLTALGAPTHYRDIHTLVMKESSNSLQSSLEHTYATLFYRPDIFRTFRKGVFGLVSWRRQVANMAGEMVFDHCPQPLLPTKPLPNAFFESIMVGRELSKTSAMTVEQFWLEMLAWAGRSEYTVHDAQQSFDAWHAAGLLEHVDFITDRNKPVKLTIPNDAKLADIRQHCLNHLCSRIIRMPEVLLTIDQVANPTVATVQQVLFGGERIGSDVAIRLSMLASFGAVQAEGDSWRLTDLGRNVIETSSPEELPDFSEIEGFQKEEPLVDQLEWDEELEMIDL